MAFVFKITTTASPQTFTIPCQDVGTFNATIDWGDGSPTSSITAYNDADLAHSYATAGQYTVTITGTFPNIYFNNGGDAGLLDEVVDLGDVGWESFERAFYGCSNMTSFSAGTTDTSSVTDMGAMFFGCSSLTSLDVSAFDTSSVTAMNSMFRDCSSLTALDVSAFDTSSVTAMNSMFHNCSGLTALDVSNFDVSSVTDMSFMFFGCSGLTALDVSNFDVSSVTDMTSTFRGCSSLTALDVSGFDTSSVTAMTNMFFGCSSLTALDVSAFNTSSVTAMISMFYLCSSLTSLDVSAFDVSNVTNMSFMFRNCSSLTALDVGAFNTANVTDMSQMFRNCSSLTGLQISGWDISSVTDGTDFLLGANAALSQAEYDATLLAWAQQTVQPDVTWHFGDATYSNTPIAVSIQMDGRMTGESLTFADWSADASNNILLTSGTSDFTFTQEAADTVDSVTGGSFTSGVNVPFNIASRHGSTFINGAIDGTALTANTTPTALPDLSSTDLDLGYDYMGTIKKFRLWADDLGDAGIEAASA